ncbi:MAG TPA: phosphotransferase, partial [Acidimicrobiia bacterium]|nr:phosphotransferase [Acidimicrobiia bacterium]
LEEQNFAAAPRLLDVDEGGCLVLSYIDGFGAPDLDVSRWTPEQIEAAFALLRRYHDITAGSPLAGSAEVVCHNDFTPQNVVFDDGAPVGIIDWEWAAPGSRRRDLGHAIWQWLNVSAWGPPIDDLAQLIHRALGAYGLAADASIPADIEAREVEWLNIATQAARAGHDTWDRSPAHWTGTAQWVAEELRWLRSHATVLADAINAYA